MWVVLGFGGLVAWLAATVWFVRRADHGQKPYVDPYDVQ